MLAIPESEAPAGGEGRAQGASIASVVFVTLEANADPVPMLKLQGETWELNVWAPLEDFARLRTIRDAKWAERTSLAVGT